MRKKIVISLTVISLLVIAIGLVSANNQFVNLKQGVLMKKIFTEDELFSYDDMGTFSHKKHQYLVAVLENKGISKKEAISEAFDYQIRELALNDKADEMGVIVSKEEAYEHAKKLREMIESGITDDGTPLDDYKEHQLRAEQTAEGLGLTIEQYWNEYVPANAINSMKLSKLQEKLFEGNKTTGIPIEDLNKVTEQIVEEYKNKNSNIILELKKEVGL